MGPQVLRSHTVGAGPDALYSARHDSALEVFDAVRTVIENRSTVTDIPSHMAARLTE